MNGWNRVFVVVAVVWVIVAPFLLVSENNKFPLTMYSMCSDLAYRLYGSGSSSKLDMDRYRAEGAKCLETLQHHFISVPGIFSAMIGAGDWKLGGVAWGSSSFH
jgi:hypothetical protein